jgi:hypothetical protein
LFFFGQETGKPGSSWALRELFELCAKQQLIPPIERHVHVHQSTNMCFANARSGQNGTRCGCTSLCRRWQATLTLTHSKASPRHRSMAHIRHVRVSNVRHFPRFAVVVRPCDSLVNTFCCIGEGCSLDLLDVYPRPPLLPI